MVKKNLIGIIIISISIFLVSYLLLNNPLKDDFEKTKREVRSGNPEFYSNIADITEDYYKKPEFYPWYDEYKNKKNTNQTGTYGYGGYPSEVSYNVNGFKSGQFLDVYTFVHASYDVGNYQGIKLSFLSPDGDLFDTETYPDDILLAPLKENSTDWTYKIRMRVVAKKDIPEGRYVFKLSAGQPSPEKRREYQNMTGNYTSVGMIQPGKFFDFVLYAYN